MGWGRMLLMGNVGQQLDIGDVENAVTEMQSAFLENQQVDLKQERRITELRRENQELKLYLHGGAPAGFQGCAESRRS